MHSSFITPCPSNACYFQQGHHNTIPHPHSRATPCYVTPFPASPLPLRSAICSMPCMRVCGPCLFSSHHATVPARNLGLELNHGACSHHSHERCGTGSQLQVKTRLLLRLVVARGPVRDEGVVLGGRAVGANTLKVQIGSQLQVGSGFGSGFGWL